MFMLTTSNRAIRKWHYILTISCVLCSCSLPAPSKHEDTSDNAQYWKEVERLGDISIGLIGNSIELLSEVRACLARENIAVSFLVGFSFQSSIVVPKKRARDAIRALRAWPSLQSRPNVMMLKDI